MTAQKVDELKEIIKEVKNDVERIAKDINGFNDGINAVDVARMQHHIQKAFQLTKSNERILKALSVQLEKVVYPELAKFNQVEIEIICREIYFDNSVVFQERLEEKNFTIVELICLATLIYKMKEKEND